MINNLSEVKTQAEAVIYFLQRMDADMLNEILDETFTYQEMPKHIFLHKLSVALDDFANGGDTFLNCFSGNCGEEGCNYKCKGYSFIGNVTSNYMDLIIEVKRDKVVDMYECAVFKCNSFVTKNERVRIDRFEFRGDLPF